MSRVEIHEVGLRDGFQNVEEYIPMETRIHIVEGLLDAGIQHAQICSFVSPKAIPQMREAREFAEYCLTHYKDADFYALVPNLRGAAAAWESGIKKVSYVVSLSLSHNQANIRRNHEESYGELLNIRDVYPDLEICLDLATAFACPYEGMKTSDHVLDFIKPYADCGIQTLNLCDTIGRANPAQVREIIKDVKSAYPSLDLMVHIHDTRNMGMVNTLAAIESGVSKVQSTLGGLGGCPFAPGASGNLATEDLLFMLSEMGFNLNIDIEKMISLARYQAGAIPEGQFSGHLFTIEKE